MNKRISMASPLLNGNEKKYLNECIDTGWISANGHFVREFEDKFAEYIGTKYALTFANGTVSLHLALEMAGISEGDEVIMPTLTYIATANAVKYCGGVPVFADSDAVTWNVNPAEIEKRITKKTKAIMPVHLYGCPCNMESINYLAKEHNLIVIEDAAESHGAEFNGHKTGGMSLVGSFSFFGNKIITCGEGGMLTTNDKKLYEMLKLYKGQGMDPNRRYWHTVVGYNYRMTNMQAAVGLAQLENIEYHLNERRRVRNLYEKYLSQLSDYISFQGEQECGKSVYWMTSIMLTDAVDITRDEVMLRMEEKNIEMRPVFYPMHVMPPYLDNNTTFPIAEKIASRGISLPSHASLTEEDIEFIVNSLKNIIKG